MNWRKLFKYTTIFIFLILAAFAYLAIENMKQIYGGHTKVVDYNQFKVSHESICIDHVSILSTAGDTFIPNQTVCIENGIIVSIDTSLTESRTSGSIDGKGKFLIPGLIDSHVHLWKSPNDLLLYVANGVTGIREMIGDEDILSWRKEISNGRLGPDMYIASPRLGSFGLIEGWFMKWTQGFNNISNAEEAESMVEAYALQGYDAVKIYSYLNKEAFDAVNMAAKLKGMDVVGHVPFSLLLADVLNSNQSEIAHLEEVMNALRREFGNINDQKRATEFLTYVEKRSGELASEFVENGVSVTTTLWLTQSFVRQKFDLENVLKGVELEYENPGISEWDEMIPQGLGWLPEVNRYKLPENLSDEDKVWQKVFWSTYGGACAIILRNFSEGGVNIMAGTDANLPPTVPGFSLHDELISMNEAGMSNSDVLQSATSIPAQWLGNNTGKIEPGYKANLVLLEGNPLKDMASTKKINTVFLNGRILDRTILDEILESVKKANDESRKKDINQFTAIENSRNTGEKKSELAAIRSR